VAGKTSIQSTNNDALHGSQQEVGGTQTIHHREH